MKQAEREGRVFSDEQVPPTTRGKAQPTGPWGDFCSIGVPGERHQHGGQGVGWTTRSGGRRQ
jgi:hypothetical protein